MDKLNQTSQDDIIVSKAGFHGYCIWIRPQEDTPTQKLALHVNENFRRRFKPLLLPTWQPHICLVAGIDNEASAISCAEKLAAEIKKFTVRLSSAEVDGESIETRATIYFPWQRLRAAWIAASVESSIDEYGNDYLGYICRRGREILGRDTQIVKFKPHMSLVYFDETELNNEQRMTLKKELNEIWEHGIEFDVESIHVAKTEGTPDKYELLKSFLI